MVEWVGGGGGLLAIELEMIKITVELGFLCEK